MGLAVGLSSCLSDAEIAQRNTERAAQLERGRKAAEEAEYAKQRRVWVESVANGNKAKSLRKFVSGNSDLGEGKRAHGNALLEAFASEYLPNGFVRYKAARVAALEKQAAYCELLDTLQRQKTELSRNKIFLRFLTGYYDVAKEYFDLRREIIDLYAQHKIGVLSVEDLVAVDDKMATRSKK